MVENDGSAAAPVAASSSRVDSQRCDTEARARRRMAAPDDGGPSFGNAFWWVVWLFLALLMALFLTFAAALPSQAQVEDTVTAPSAPQNLMAMPDDSQMTLTWKAPADDGGAEVYSTYEYSYHPVGDEDDARTGLSGSLTLTISDLTNGTRYVFMVRAENAAGFGAWASVEATVAALPDPPQKLLATPGDGRMTLTWEAPASDGGAAITRYDYNYHKVRGGGVTEVAGDLSLTATVTGLANGTEYNFLVWAVNSTGAGQWAIVRGIPAAVPGAPQNLTATPHAGFVFFEWDAPASNGGAAIEDYEYRYAEGASVPADTAWETAAWEQETIFGLTIGTAYTFEVRAENSIGAGPAVSIAATPRTVPGAPRNLAATPGDSRVTLTWDAPASNGGAAITRYEYAKTAVGTLDWISVGTDLTVTVKNLTNGTSVPFHVRAVNAAGEGAVAFKSATPSVDPVVTVHPEQAAYRFVEDASDADVAIVARTEAGARRPSSDFTVTVVTQPVSGGATSPDDYSPLSMVITFKPGEFGTVDNAWVAAKQVALAILEDGISEDDETFEVRLQMSPARPAWLAFREADGTTACGNDGCLMTVTIAANGPPTAPRNLNSVAGDEGVRLDWDVPATSGGAAIADYEYRHAAGASVPDSTTWTNAGDVLSVRVGNLTNGTEYAFEVRAVNEMGPGAAAGTTANVPTLTTLSVADARAREGVDTTIDFAVALSRTSSLTVTVDYATADGSAKAGEDYTRSAGTLTFLAGEIEKSVSVALLDDVKDEGEETITLALSRASGARIARATATGTIVNDDDAMPRAWLVRFGRTVAGQVVDAVSARLDSASHEHVRVAGVPVESEADAAPPVRPFDRLDPSPRPLREESRAASPTVREVMLGSSFHLSSEESGDGPVVSTWGRVATGGFEARVDGARMDGAVTSGLIGVDADWGRVLAGAMIDYSEGRGTFGLTGDLASSRAHGRVESTLAGVYPYIRGRVNERTSVWVLAGAGTGTLTLTEDGGAPIETDIDMRLGAIGGRETLVPASGTDGIALSAEVDAFWVRTSSEAMRSEETGHLAASKAGANRVRMMLEGERVFALADGGTITPTVTLGARHDGGDAETGAGFEAGAGVRYIAHGVTVEGTVRALVAHDADGYEEWGASGAIRIDPDVSGRGLSFTLAPALGATTAGGTAQPWSLRDVQGLAAHGGNPTLRRVESELGYGLGAPGGVGVVTPYTGLSVADGGARTWRIGGRWAVATAATLGVEASRSKGAGAGPGQALVLRASAHW